LHLTVVIAFCRTWRLLFYPFQFYPWLLAPIFDPAVSDHVKQECMRTFLAIPRGSNKLDPGLGRKLRELVKTVDDLMDPTLHDFLRVLFERIVVTSTFVERIFKDLTSWTGRHGQTIAAIGAKYVNVTFDGSVQRWRRDVGAESLCISGNTT
jgi:hypothetical protein